MVKKCKDCPQEEVEKKENPEVRDENAKTTFRFIKEGVAIEANSLAEAQEILNEMKKEE